MSITAGIDVGSTYTKTVLLDVDNNIVARHQMNTGFKLAEVAEKCFHACLAAADLTSDDVAYIIATGYGRHQVTFKDVMVTDITASARGCHLLFPDSRTVLDVGGQTMKAIRLEPDGKVKSFRQNDKCAAGTGAFLEKTARYMGYETNDIGGLLDTSRDPAEISGVCAVFAESEVINQLSLGTPPADIMQGAIESLTGRSVQLMKRIKALPEYTLVGGILRFSTMAQAVRDRIESEVNVPPDDMCQYVGAVGAGILGHRRLQVITRKGARAVENQSAEL